MKYKDLQEIHKEYGLPDPCPGCFKLWQKKIASRMDMLPLRGGAMDGMSRYGEYKVCCRCGKMEFLMGYANLSLSQAYPAAYTDWAEAIRLPPGLLWGASLYPTGGWDEWDAYMEKRNAAPFYAFDWDAGNYLFPVAEEQ